MKRMLCLLAVLGLAATALPAIEAGLIAGPINHETSMAYGFSVGSGFPVPFLKLEFELYKISDESVKSMSGAIKFRTKLGPLSPYAALGVGAQFGKLSFRFKQDYDGYSFLALGTHLHMSPMVSLRFDIRFLQFAANLNRTRISGGVFLHL
jgi:hypothetical protein